MQKSEQAPSSPAPKKVYKYVRKTFVYEGHQYEVTGKTDAEAYEKIGKKKAALVRGEVGISGNMTVKAWATEFVAAYITPRIRPMGSINKAAGTLTKKSSEMYTQKIDGYILPAIGGLRLKEVTATHLQKILNSQSGKSFSHVNKLLNVMQQLFHRAYRERLVLFDPAEDLSMPYVERRTRRSLTELELKAFHAVSATHKHGLWAEFHLRFGVREGEVPPLQVMDLDFATHRLHVYQAVESGSGAIKDPKTKAGSRYIPIPLDFEPQLKHYVTGRGPFEYLFPSENDGMMTQSGITRRWRSFKRSMDIELGAKVDEHGKIRAETSTIAQDLTLHCLRHTYCTDLGARGIDASIGRFATGHADVATLSNIYTHTNDAIMQTIADKLNTKPEEADSKTSSAK